jgi:hypothetical protein
MKKLHSNLKWKTLVERANKKAGFEKYRIEPGGIFELSKSYNAYLFQMSFHPNNKQDFVEQEEAI